jgi:hypothetical protein
MEFILGGLILAAIVVYFLFRSKGECTHLSDHDFPDMVETPMYVPEKFQEHHPKPTLPKTLEDVIREEAPEILNPKKAKKPRRQRTTKVVAPSPEILSVYKDPILEVAPKPPKARKPRNQK